MKARKNLSKENKDLKTRLAEAEELLAAIKRGEVDAFVTDDQQVFTLKSADHAYRVLVETINEGAATLTFDGAIMYCNSRLSRMVDIPIEKIIGSSVFDLVGSDELPRLKSVLHQCETSTARSEFRLKKSDGTFLPVLASCNSLKLTEKALCMVVTDLTEQKNTEFELEKHRRHLEDLVEARTEELRESEKKLLDIYVSMSEGLALHEIVYDNTGKPVDYILTEVNPAFEKIIGLAWSQVIGKKASDVYGIGEPPYLDVYDRVASTGISASFEVDFSPMKKHFHISVFSPDKGKFATIFQDITERKRAEELIQQALRDVQVEKDKLTRLIDNISDEVWLADTNKKFILMNPPALKAFGLVDMTKEIDVENFAISLEVHRPDMSLRPVEEAPPLRALRGEAVKNQEEIIRIPASGELRYRQVSASPIKDAAGNIVGSVSIVRDITERKQAEEVLKRDEETLRKLVNEQAKDLIVAQVELERAKRLSDIGTLAATVAHELRNPLAAIGVTARNIKRKANNPDIDRQVYNIDKKVAESDQIISNLLFYSRLKSPHYESINIFDTVEECVAAAEQQQKKEATVIKNLDSIKGIMIEADPLQIREVFNNILNNAYDAISAEKGQIKITAENEDDFIKVTIEDSGAGIVKDILDKIFEPFFTTKAKGTGLGLSVCRQIINMHDGEIGVKSELGHGTSFIVRLPKEGRKEGRKVKWPLNEY